MGSSKYYPTKPGSDDDKPEDKKEAPKPKARPKSKIPSRGTARKDRKKLRIRQTSVPKKKDYEVLKVHTLGDKETWTHLAAKYYGNTTEPYWRHIYEFNKETVGDNYKRIFGGMEIKIPELPDELKKKDK